MRQMKIGAVTIDAVIERDGPWRRPEDFFPAHDRATFERHLPPMEPEVFEPALGMMVMTQQRDRRSVSETGGNHEMHSLARHRSAVPRRSEEPTSELQSIMRSSYAFFC